MMKNNVVLFDGVCSFCNSSVMFLIKRDHSEFLSFSSLQSSYGQKLLEEFNLPKDDFDSFIYITNGKVYSKSTAALKIAHKLSFPYNLLYGLMLIPIPIRDKVYSIIARNRYRWFRKKTSCEIPPEHIRKRFLDDKSE
jgi:predicted DCC family thiol-disulfide oxidoreductase YuxK